MIIRGTLLQNDEMVKLGEENNGSRERPDLAALNPVLSVVRV